MVRTQISLDPVVYESAKEEARRLGISFAELVRRSLASSLQPSTVEPPWMRFAGTVEDGDADASSSIDEVVYGRERP